MVSLWDFQRKGKLYRTKDNTGMPAAGVKMMEYFVRIWVVFNCGVDWLVSILVTEHYCPHWRWSISLLLNPISWFSLGPPNVGLMAHFPFWWPILCCKKLYSQSKSISPQQILSIPVTNNGYYISDLVILFCFFSFAWKQTVIMKY